MNSFDTNKTDDTEKPTDEVAAKDSGVSSLPDGSDEKEPMTIGQLGMWIFISTEVMMMAAIVAAYLIYRISALGEGWPSGYLMGVSVPTGIFNTITLVLSGVTGWWCYHSARDDQPKKAKLWLVVTLMLGCVFMGLKSSEYYHKYKLGLMPTPGKRQIYEKADIAYVAAVNEDLKNRIAAIEKKSSELAERGLALTESEEERLQLIYFLKQNLVEPTSKQVGRGQEAFLGKMAMRLMASQIYYHPDTERNVEEVANPEKDNLTRQLDNYDSRIGHLGDRIAYVKRQVTSMEEEIKQLELLKPGSEELKERQQWLAVKRKQSGDLNIELKRVEGRRRPIQGRFDVLMDYTRTNEHEGGDRQRVNEKHDIRLPVVIRNGQAWMSMYLLLTGMHLLHLLAGMAVLVWWLPRKLNITRGPALYVTFMFWQFVDVMWLCIFWLIYF